MAFKEHIHLFPKTYIFITNIEIYITTYNYNNGTGYIFVFGPPQYTH